MDKHSDTAQRIRAPGALGLLTFAALAFLTSQLAAAVIHPADTCAPMLTPAGAVHEADCFSLGYKGRVRTFRVYARLRGHEPAPLIVVLHDAGGSGGDMEWLTRRGFNRIADRESAIVVYADGVSQSWNDGRAGMATRAQARNVDDIGFLRALPRALAARYPVDPFRVYAAGFASGGMMSFRLACDAADIYTAVAAVAAGLPARLAARCKPVRAVSVAILDGTDDPLLPWHDATAGNPQTGRDRVLSPPATAARWVHLDHCEPLRAGERVDMQPDDQTAVVPRTARCLDQTEVQLHEIEGGGHAWPGGESAVQDESAGRTSREIDANEVIWDFLVQHRLSEAAEETRL